MTSTRPVALLTVAVMTIATGPGFSQAPAPPPAPPPQTRSQASPASKPPPKTATPQTYPAEQVKAGQSLFAAQCGFCHGRDAEGGESGTDLTRSTIVANDVRGDKIRPVVRDGRPDKGMPPFSFSDPDLTAIVAFIHDRTTAAASELGGRRSVDVADLQTGNADAGRTYFNGAGGCATCHSATGDLAGIAKRYQGLALLQRLLYPGSGGNAGPRANPPAITVTLSSGERVTGKLTYRDEFTIGMTDASGWYRSWPIAQIKFTVDNPLDAHIAQLGKYTDDDMHNVFAYLQTLR